MRNGIPLRVPRGRHTITCILDLGFVTLVTKLSLGSLTVLKRTLVYVFYSAIIYNSFNIWCLVAIDPERLGSIISFISR